MKSSHPLNPPRGLSHVTMRRLRPVGHAGNFENGRDRGVPLVSLMCFPRKDEFEAGLAMKTVIGKGGWWLDLEQICPPYELGGTCARALVRGYSGSIQVTAARRW